MQTPHAHLPSNTFSLCCCDFGCDAARKYTPHSPPPPPPAHGVSNTPTARRVIGAGVTVTGSLTPWDQLLCVHLFAGHQSSQKREVTTRKACLYMQQRNNDRGLSTRQGSAGSTSVDLLDQKLAGPATPHVCGWMWAAQHFTHAPHSQYSH